MVYLLSPLLRAWKQQWGSSMFPRWLQFPVVFPPTSSAGGPLLYLLQAESLGLEVWSSTEPGGRAQVQPSWRTVGWEQLSGWKVALFPRGGPTS